MKKIKLLLSLSLIFTFFFSLASCKNNTFFFSLASCNNNKDQYLLNIKTINNNCGLALDPTNNIYKKSINAIKDFEYDQTSPVYLFENQLAAVSDIHRSTSGEVSKEKACGYSFFIVNKLNNEDITLKLKLSLIKDTGASDAIRVMTYYESDGFQNFRVYQKKDSVSQTYDAYTIIKNRNALKYFNDGDSIVFDTNSVDENIVVSGNAGSNYIRYTILFWIEGDDPDCNENILGKKASFKLEVDAL